MKFYISLAVSIALVFSTSDRTLAQGLSRLVLVKPDTASAQSCSFISTRELEKAEIGQRMTLVQPGLSREGVKVQIGFPPDQPESGGVLRWTAEEGENYVRAVVNFSNNGASNRSLTMITNYKQPDEKQCLWEVKEIQENVNLPNTNL